MLFVYLYGNGYISKSEAKAILAKAACALLWLCVLPVVVWG